MSANGTDPDDGDRSHRWCLEEGVRNDPGHAVDELERLTAERDAARALLSKTLARPSIDQARGALGWLLSHWFGDGGETSGNMPGEYAYACEILGDCNVEQLGTMLAEPRAELGRFRRVITEYVNAVEDGEKFGALVELVPGLVSDDGQYGAVDRDPWLPVIGRVQVVDGGAS